MKQHKLTKEQEKRFDEFWVNSADANKPIADRPFMKELKQNLAKELNLQATALKEGLDKNYCKRTGCMVCK